jgi:PAT family beta-lactamase induction signal transducer AmpG
LIEKGFTPEDVGVVVTTVSLFANVFGTIAGGVLTDRIGMGRTLWFTGIAQAIGCLAYAVVDSVGGPTSSWYVDPARLTMYAAVGGEQFIQGMGAGALGVLMLRLTAKQFSATQFALLSSLVALPRVIVGPFAGVLAYSLGWKLFFIITVPIAIPGLVMLARFVPFMARDARIDDAIEAKRDPIMKLALAVRAMVAFAVALVVGLAWSAFLGGMADSRKQILSAKSFDEVEPVIVDAILKHVHSLTAPSTANEWVDLLGPLVFAVVVAAGTAALTVARRGVASRHH